MDWSWWILIFGLALVVVLAFTLYGRRQRTTGIAKHPIEDRPGAPGVAGESGTGPVQQRSREDNPSQHGAK